MSVLPEEYQGPPPDRLAAAVDSESATTLSVVAPATGATIGTVPACSPADLDRAVDRAREAQHEWATRSVADRAAIIERFASLVRADRSGLVDLIQLESGKARLDATEEALDVELTASHYAARGPARLGADRRKGVVPFLTRPRRHRDPYGVAGFITPWNYPLSLAVGDAVPALLAGNAAVIKPAETTPFTALFAAALLVEAGVPEDCVQVVTGEGPALGPTLVDAVDHVTFTGSTAIGREVAARAGETLTAASLELGGRGPMVVRADAPLARTVTGAVRGAFASAGQLCIATERMYVHADRYEVVRDRLVARTRALTVGAGLGDRYDVGTMISERECDRVATLVEEAVAAGADLLTGGRRRPDVGPHVYEPTVLADVPASTRLADEEAFGPVVTIRPVPDDETAIELVNDSRYGLHGSVWTGDVDAGRRVARRLECGTVTVNDAYAAMWGSVDAPMGGRKDSGIGRRHGDEGIETYTHTQSVTVQRGHPIAPPAGVSARVFAGLLAAYVRVVRGLGLR